MSDSKSNTRNTDHIATQRIPREWANWRAEVTLASVVMPVARDLAAAAAATQPLAVLR